MLRRTNAEQAKQVYEKLIAGYPHPNAISRACDKDLAAIMEPLGLRWRIKPFCSMVRELETRYESVVPDKREELKKLPGVGDYVAGAVLSIAFNKKEWIVDSNVVRVFKRYFDLKTSKEGRRDRHIIAIAKIYASTKNPRDANLAILDFAALVCTPRNPNHGECPLRKKCNFTDRQVA
ncbi:MAG: hypothetical protein KBH86_08430 [Syntrophorhabdus sp.]|nr:hypothetical protein [Syntrophorhabdus sp.]